MKNKFSKILLFLSLLILVFALTACGNVITLTDLNAPTGLTVTDNVLHWNSVNGANAYIVNRDGIDLATVSDVQYPLTGLTDGTTYVFKVKAKHTLGAYNDSQYSETLSYLYVAPQNPDDGTDKDPDDDKPSDLSPLLSPSNIVINDGVITWDAVDNAVSYVISINGTEYTASTNELTISSLKDGVYNIKVKAVGDGKTYSASEFTDEMAIDLYDGSVCTTEQFGNFKDINQFESFLGYGFDVVADSIVSDRTVLTSFPIFNVDELMKLRFLKVNSKSSQVKIISEDNMESFSEQWNSALNVNVSMSGNFSSVKVGGSVKLKEEFSVAANSAKSTYYYCITITDQKFYIVMQGDMDTYRSMLSAGFEKDLYDKNIDPAVLFQRYGTHFITSAVMGGRMNAFYNMYSLSESVTEKEYIDVATAISVSFGNLFSLNTDISFNQTIQNAKQKNSVNTKESIDVMGGADFGIGTISQVPDVYADWQKSLDAYPSLMGIKDSSSLIGIWELIDSARDNNDDWTWIDENGHEQHGTRAQQLQAYFYKYGLENYNQLMAASNLPETVKPEAIGNVLINGNGADRDGYYSVDADSINSLSFSVLPDNAVGYTKSYSLSDESKEYAYIENGELIVRPATVIPPDTVLYLTVSAGNVQKTLRLRVLRKYNVTFGLNFTTDYVVSGIYGVTEGTAISPPTLMSKADGTDNDVAIERFGYRLVGWASYLNGEYVNYDFSKPVSSNLNLFAQWQKITNIVTFDAQGGSFENGQSSLSSVVDYSMCAEAPEDNPTRDYYEFMGWYTEKNGSIPFDFDDTPILKKTTVYAKWIPIQYTVTINYNNGAVTEKAYTSVEFDFAISVNNPTKANYDFVTWALADGTEIDIDTYLFKQNCAIKAVYTPTLYTVTFNTDGGSEIAPISASVETNFLLSERVPSPEKVGYTFKAWRVYINNKYEELSDLSNISIRSNITATALYEVNKYTVTFNSNGGNSISSYDNVQHGMTIPMPTSPEKDGYEFVGWYKDASLEKRFSFEADTITADTTLYASWTKNLLFTVTFFSNIPDKVFEPITVEKDTVLSSRFTEDMNVDYVGFRFDGWFTDESLETFFNPDTPITENIILYAKWVALSYKLEFLDGDEVLESKVYSFGDEIIAPQNPAKDGHTFMSWSEDIPQTMPAKDVQIMAIFVANTYSISYLLSEDGEVYREKSFTFGEAINFVVDEPEQVGYAFTGWSIELPDNMPSHDIVVFAQWSVKSYTIAFYLTSSTDVYSEKYTELKVEFGTPMADVNISTPTASDGYYFDGWDFGGLTTMPAEDIDAFAIFERVSVNVTLEYGAKRKTVNALFGTNLSEIFAQVTLQDSVNLYDGTWRTENGIEVSEDATVPSKNVKYIANYSIRKTTFTHTGCTATDKMGVDDYASVYMTLNDLSAFNTRVLNKICGSINLEISFDSNQDVIFDVISGGTSLLNVQTGTSSGNKSFSFTVNTSYQNLLNGLQFKFTEGYAGWNLLNVVISNVKVTVTASETYCVDFNGKLYFFDTLDEANSITYTTTSKSSTVETVATSPTRVTRTKNYTFVNWKVGNSTVSVINNKLQLSLYFDGTHSIKVAPFFKETYSSTYSASTLTKTAYYDSKITDDSKDAFVTFGMKEIKTMLSTYNLKLTSIQISVYITEINDGWQEIYLTKGKRSGWSNASHVFNDGDVIYSNSDIGTGAANTTTSGTFTETKSGLSYDGSSLPNELYMYFGAHGNGEDDYKVSDIKIILTFASK